MKATLLKNRRVIAEMLQLAAAAAALTASFLLRFEFTLEPGQVRMLIHALPLVLTVKLVMFRAFGLRDLAWRHVGFPDLARIAAANAAASAVATPVLRLAIGSTFPRSIHVLDFLLSLTLMVAVRSAIKLLLERRSLRPAKRARRTLIYGAGSAGVTVLNELRADPGIGYQVIGLLDDDPDKRSMRIQGARVLGERSELLSLAKKHRIEDILIALPNATGDQIAAILEQCHAARVEAKRVPALAELIDHRVLTDQIREVRLEDLLGRPPARLRTDSLCLADRVVLVTGAGGSIGSELCRQLARHRPARLVGLDQAETGLYQIEHELRTTFPEVEFYPEVGSIQSRTRIEEVFERHAPQSVYHAAAYKHVPMMETHLFEAVENNVFGTRNVARAAAAAGVEDFVLVSTDKAVRPSSVMGATKRVAEMVCQAGRNHTKFVAVRFGNVLGSNGSVIPLFREQIAAGGPITVTHPEMRRFFMTVGEAAQLLLEAGLMGSGGEIFVLDMGKPVRIVDLARKMVLLSGLRPDVDIRIVFSEPRPGEKMYEEVSALEENTAPTPHSQIRVFRGRHPPVEPLARMLQELRGALDGRDAGGVVMCLKALVPNYKPSSIVLREAERTRFPRAAHALA
jgi:FlaA1/EpsC-like NDP-sugar epimerase